MNNVPEEWRPIEGYEGQYEVSNHGRIKSLPRTVITKAGHRMPIRGRIMAPFKKPRYYKLLLTTDGRQKDHYVHVLVARAFLGPKPPGHEVNHKNRDNHDNRVENLEYVTHARNIQHSHLGEHKAAKLDATKVRDLRRRYANGERIADLAREHGVMWVTIQSAIKGKTWSFVE